jgi:hypothetical protein
MKLASFFSLQTLIQGLTPVEVWQGFLPVTALFVALMPAEAFERHLKGLPWSLLIAANGCYHLVRWSRRRSW